MAESRKEWLNLLLAIVSRVLDALEKGELKKTMPLSFHVQRSAFAPLEAFGRSLQGLAPWLEADSSRLDPQEKALQERYRHQVLRCLDMATDPQSPDFMLFDRGGQPLVDAAFLAHALVRAKGALVKPLTKEVRDNLANALKSSRGITACNTNWLFFSAMVEAGPFRFSRNPIYLGFLVAMLGFALRWGDLWGWVALPLGHLLLDRLVVAKEEAYLATRFGAAYDAYRSRVRRWL